MSYGQIMELLQRYDRFREVPPSYSLKLNQIMDSINKRYNSVIPFRYIGQGSNKKLLGFVEEGDKINVYDGFPMLAYTLARSSMFRSKRDKLFGSIILKYG